MAVGVLMQKIWLIYFKEFNIWQAYLIKNNNIMNLKISITPLKRIVGIDQLRYLFAFWVLIMHGGLLPFFEGNDGNNSINTINKIYGWSINGEAAVIGFFIISGLCIHYPNVARKKLQIIPFYVARIIRLCLPLVIYLFISKMAGYSHNEGFLRVVPIWSLYCEIIYYLLYPLFFYITKAGRLNVFLCISVLFSITLMICLKDKRETKMYFHELEGKYDFFAWQAAIMALPCWLLGVYIAERISLKDIIDKVLLLPNKLWLWRIGALFISSSIIPIYRIGLYYHFLSSTFLGLIFTSQFTTVFLFGIYAAFWIEQEVVWHNYGGVRSSSFLDKLGLATYSIYLIHTLVFWWLKKFESIIFIGYLANWIVMILCVHVFALFFYQLVELPSQIIARRVFKSLTQFPAK
ncbi:acyltransferase family protein [Parasediminibacterium paludis]|uniref:Acyltransferase family protein n=1 Tax=Parasediminibacterium paludis TaxID=908966 RepID=A0ABV8PYY5_9BACT